MSFWRLVVEDEDGDRTEHIRREVSQDSAKEWGETCFGVGSVISVSDAGDEVRKSARHLRELISECWEEGPVTDLFLDELETYYIDEGTAP